MTNADTKESLDAIVGMRMDKDIISSEELEMSATEITKI